MIIGIDGHDLEGKRTGVGVYLMNILRAWERSGVLAEHDVVTFHKDEIPDDLPEGVRGVRTHPLFGKSSTAVFTHWLLPRAASNAAVDVLFCPGYITPLFWRGRTVLTLHDIIYEAHPEWFRWNSKADQLLLKRFSRASAMRADVILTPSHFSASEIERYYGVDPYKIVVTPLDADPTFSPERDPAAEKAVRETYSLTGSFFFSIGTIQSRRHIPEAIAAFAHVAWGNPAVQYLIAGGNQTDPHVDIERLVNDMNASLGREAIRYVPFADRQHLSHLYRAAAGLVWLSDYEGFGLPPLEAMASGTPVITSDSSCLPETVGDAALLIRNNTDTEEIATAMRTLLTDKKTVKRLTEGGLKRAAQFSWDKCAEQTLEALRAAAASH